MYYNILSPRGRPVKQLPVAHKKSQSPGAGGRALSAHPAMYADNTTLFCDINGNPADEHVLNTELCKITHWLSLNVNPLVPGLFSLKSAYRPEAYFGKLMYEGHLFLEMLLFCNPLKRRSR